MNWAALSVLLFLFVAVQEQPKPKFPLGKETTYLTGPVDKEGYIDYEAALNDRLGKGITPEKNANVLIWKALGPHPEGGLGMPEEFYKRLGIAEPPEQDDYFISLHGYLKKRLQLDEGEIETLHEQQERATQRPWKATDHPRLVTWLQLNEKPLAVVIEATQRPEYFNPLVSRKFKSGPAGLMAVLLPGAQKCREVANALATRAMLQTSEGKYDAAWQDLLACHRQGRLLSRGGTLIEALVGFAISFHANKASLAYLDRAPLEAKQVRTCLRDLQALPPFAPMEDKIELSERFMFLDYMHLVRRYGVRYLDGLAGAARVEDPHPQELQRLAAIDWAPALQSGNRWYDRRVAALRIPDRPNREKALDQIDEELRALKKEAADQADAVAALALGRDPGPMAGEKIGNILLCLFAPATRQVQASADKADQGQRNLRVAFALAAYRREHNRYPAKLDDLAPTYLATMPNDLFSGQELHYRTDGKGYLFYSVGLNGRDDEGRMLDDEPPGGDDIAVRMPLPPLKPKE